MEQSSKALLSAAANTCGRAKNLGLPVRPYCFRSRAEGKIFATTIAERPIPCPSTALPKICPFSFLAGKTNSYSNFATTKKRKRCIRLRFACALLIPSAPIPFLPHFLSKTKTKSRCLICGDCTRALSSKSRPIGSCALTKRPPNVVSAPICCSRAKSARLRAYTASIKRSNIRASSKITERAPSFTMAVPVAP